jgi:hypothetical protein
MTRTKGRSLKTMPAKGQFLAYSPYSERWMQVERFDHPGGRGHAVVEPYSGKWFTPTCWAPLPVPIKSIRTGRSEGTP